MKKILTTVVALFILVAFSFPLVSASSVEGTGQDRTVLFATPEGDANFTVGVPAILNNGLGLVPLEVRRPVPGRARATRQPAALMRCPR